MTQPNFSSAHVTVGCIAVRNVRWDTARQFYIGEIATGDPHPDKAYAIGAWDKDGIYPECPLLNLVAPVQSTHDITVTINGRRGMFSGFSFLTKTFVFSMFNGEVYNRTNLSGVFFDYPEDVQHAYNASDVKGLDFFLIP